MSEGRIRGSLTKVRLLIPVWLKRAASEIGVLRRRAFIELGDLPRRALAGTAYWAGYASNHWHLGRAHRRRSLPPGPDPSDGDREDLERLDTVACVNFLMGPAGTEELLVDLFLNGYALHLQTLDGFQQAVLARDQRSPDLYVVMTLWDSLAAAQAAPELPKDVQDLRIITSTKVLKIVGRKSRKLDRGERRSVRTRQQPVAVG
ncbi:MAG: antibiotic biosynthesis monooxygenase family protein [Candidatus Methylomirabilales bacterium]